MSETKYPKEVTKDNIQQLKEKAIKIKRKAFWSMISTIALYGIISLVSMPFIFFYVGVFLLEVLPEMPSETFFGIFLVVFVIVFWVFLYLLLNLIELVLNKAFKFPSHEERIFAQCFLITYYLNRNERIKAVKEVDDFISHLSVFCKDIFNYPKRKLYAPEFNLLINGKDQIRRMIFFSEGNIPEILINFGLALVHNDNPKAYSSLKQLIAEAQKYGKLKRRLSRILARMEKYNVIVTWVLLLIPIILGVLGYLPYKG